MNGETGAPRGSTALFGLIESGASRIVGIPDRVDLRLMNRRHIVDVAKGRRGGVPSGHPSVAGETDNLGLNLAEECRYFAILAKRL